MKQCDKRYCDIEGSDPVLWREQKYVIGLSLTNKSNMLIDYLVKIFCLRNNTGELDKWERQLYKCFSFVPVLKWCKRYPSAKYIYECIFGGIEDVFMGWIDNMFEDVKRECHTNILYSDHDALYLFVKEYSLWLSTQLSTNGMIKFDEVKEKIENLLEAE